MAAVLRRIPFHGEWSGNKRVDVYFRKFRRMYWRTPVERIELKERLRDPYVPSHHKKSKQILSGMWDWNEKIPYINPHEKNHEGHLDIGQTLLHEFLHRLDPNAKEPVILKREKWLWHLFSGDQRNYIYVCFFAKLAQPLRGIRTKVTIPRKKRGQ